MVTVTLAVGLDAAAVIVTVAVVRTNAVGVPEITPVPESIVTPAGRLVAAYVSGLNELQ